MLLAYSFWRLCWAPNSMAFLQLHMIELRFAPINDDRSPQFSSPQPDQLAEKWFNLHCNDDTIRSADSDGCRVQLEDFNGTNDPRKRRSLHYDRIQVESNVSEKLKKKLPKWYDGRWNCWHLQCIHSPSSNGLLNDKQLAAGCWVTRFFVGTTSDHECPVECLILSHSLTHLCSKCCAKGLPSTKTTANR